MTHRSQRGLSDFLRHPPGERFQARFHRLERRASWATTRLLWIAIGVAVLMVGVLMLAVPGPGLLVMLIGASIIAQESLTAARALDWFELRGRALARWVSGRWSACSQGARFLVVLSALMVLAVLGYGSYAALLRV